MNNIKKLREELNLTQKQFAETIGISRANLGAIENGKVKLTDRVARDICREFGVNEDWLLNNNGKMFIDLDEDKELQILLGKLLAGENPIIADALLTLNKLDENSLNIVAKMIAALKKEGDD